MGLKPRNKTVSNVFEQIDYDIDFYQREPSEIGFLGLSYSKYVNRILDRTNL
ncbi:hypothetical protein [Arcobacter suis]|uniref:Uncharacterized protein n=1 Tax=Arcobacter suis CECT 7833 TaxID=663365 RepID=A0AAD0SR49_9BACT|nr:hypothetical protein [Arcobacter suis]AXX89509.1 hypothetical protein ASUIS_1021 [Arcobacter suis CECT 7833]